MTRFRTFANTVAFALSACVVAHPAQAQGRGDDHRNDPRKDDHGRVSPDEQKRREDEQRARDAQYRTALNQRIVAAQQEQSKYEQEHRAAMAAQHAQYVQNLREQQQRLQAARDYRNDPYYTAPPLYRYRYANAVQTVNQYGADQLRQAVNYGYQQGYQNGQADRQDGRRSNYAQSYAYRDANYGYNGNYVAQSQYNYYFRQGFQRGYSDGYANATRYGSFQNGSASILGNVLSTILGFTQIH
jgi:hypothetical protein